MKCYFCLTEPDSKNSIYNDMLYVTLKSARQNTNLDLHVLYDGSTNGRCYEILKEFDVNIILHKFSHKKYLKKIYPKAEMPQIFGRDISYDKIAGAFMRFDIPFIEKEDEYVFYADIDVLFLKDVSKHDFGQVKYLAASTEFEKTLNKTSGFNSGVMYLNVKNMKEISNKVFDMMKKGIRNPIGIVDQGYLNYLCFDEMNFMPIEFNWKPYWGCNKDAYIVHFHGMKPGGDFENSGFVMSRAALLKMLNNNWSDINGYVYYLMQYYEILGKDGKEWISNFIAMNFTTIIEYYANAQPKMMYVNQPVNNVNPMVVTGGNPQNQNIRRVISNVNPMVVTGDNPPNPHVRQVANNINSMVVAGEQQNPRIVNENKNGLPAANTEKPKLSSYLKNGEKKTVSKELIEEISEPLPSNKPKKNNKPWYK